MIDYVASMDGGYDFVDIRIDPTLGGEDGMSTTQELIRCKKTVLVFYLNFLKVVYTCTCVHVHVCKAKQGKWKHSRQTASFKEKS